MDQWDVLYIHAAKNPTNEDHKRYGIMPMGILAVLNALQKKGYSVFGINMALEASLDAAFQLPEMLKKMRYKVLLTDLHWYEHAFGAMYVAEQSKALYPQIPVIIGGYTATIYGAEILEHFPAVDFAVTGDGELPLEMLVDHLLGNADTALKEIPNLIYRDCGSILTGEKKWVQTTLDALDFVSFDFMHHGKYLPRLLIGGLSPESAPRHWLCVARGCLYNCAYCCGAKDNMQSLFGRCQVLKRSAQKVAADFVALAKKNCRVAPSHDLQMLGKAYYTQIFESIRESGLKPAMYLELFQIPTKAFVDEVAKTFSPEDTTLEISPISGNEQLRRENGKMFSNGQLYEIVQYIRSKGIKVRLYYTANVVGETKTQFEDTLFQIQYLRMALGVREIFYQRVVIDPLAGMRKWPGVNAVYNSFMDYYRYCQIPNSEKLGSTGFCDQGELPLEDKVQMCNAVLKRS